MHPSVARAIQEIDAAVFNGDTFEEDEARQELLEYIDRWKRKLTPPVEPDTRICTGTLVHGEYTFCPKHDGR